MNTKFIVDLTFSIKISVTFQYDQAQFFFIKHIWWYIREKSTITQANTS